MVWGGGESRRLTKKSHERENFEKKKSFTPSSLEKILHRPSEVFHRNLSNAHQRADWSKKLLQLKTCLLSWLLFRADVYSKRHFNQLIYLFNSFATGNQHSERIKQDCVPFDINPLIPTKLIKGLAHQRGIHPLLFSNNSQWVLTRFTLTVRSVKAVKVL